MSQSAFVLRISPGGHDKVPEALSVDELIIGWAEARVLLDPALAWEEFREIVRRTYYSNEPNLRKAGAATGHLWRFIRDMNSGADLQGRLVREVLAEIRSGRIESLGFERLVQSVLRSLGAATVHIVPCAEDKGADLLATFRIAGTFQFVVAIQAKHGHPLPRVSQDVVEQLIRGIEAESANLGMVVTSGAIADAAVQAAEQYFEEMGIRIELVDGERLPKFIVEHGVPAI